eukprot:CAMPEP_0117448828 /NCGR_PEP_ID=MMETSP0759-20121206/7614_1 /TAXON_ID=63605 /ORGANISM="Percolomonas cosmopolitus, Strain WS" /LENGTH=3481 /DNA_ID=CAMNT_0005241251 /DNA_START=477 /DNA_END=10922 /DNA_ORIENTATION=+
MKSRKEKRKRRRAKTATTGGATNSASNNHAAKKKAIPKKPTRLSILSWIIGRKKKNSTQGTTMHKLEHDNFISVTTSDSKYAGDRRRGRKTDDDHFHMDMGLEDFDSSSDDNIDSNGTRRRAWTKFDKSSNSQTRSDTSNIPDSQLLNVPEPPAAPLRAPKSRGSSFFTFLGLMRWVRNIKFVVKKGNLVIGNYKTPSYAQLSWKSSSGKFFVDEVSGLNPESNLHMKMEETKVQFLTNPQVDTNHKPHHLKFTDEDSIAMKDVVKRYRELFNEEPFPQRNLESDQGTKHRDTNGRPLSDAQNEKYPHGHTYPDPIDLSDIDQSTAFECSLVSIHYAQHVAPVYKEGEYHEPPQQQLSLEFEKFSNNTVTYGPWGDHQRTLLQEFFFPKTYKELDPLTLEEGERIGTEYFDLTIIFKQKSVWKLPFTRTPEREEEKQRGRGKQELLEVHFDAGSSILWRSPNLRRDSGSKIDININFKNVKAITTNTGAVFGEAELFEGHWVMQYSPEWNGPKEFHWDWNFTRGHLFYLWEHTAFIQDFIRDWSNWENAPEATLREFVPSTYIYTFNFFDFHMYMCVNAHNIIDTHNDFQKNDYADIRTPHLQFQFSLDNPKFNPEQSDFVFDINLFSSESSPEEKPYMKMNLHDDHPLKPHLEGEDTTFLTGKKGLLHGVYTYYNKIRKDILDSFKLDIDFYDVQGHLNGTYVRLFITWFINYFSYNSKHLTSKEFEMNGFKNDKSRQIWLLQITDDDGYRFARNDLEYYVVLHIHKGQGTLPLNLHSTHEQMGTLFCEEVSLEARYMPQYLDLCWTLAPFTGEFPVKEESGRKSRRKFVGCTGMSGWGKMPTGPPPDHNFYYMDMDFQFGEITGEIVPSQCRDVIFFLKNWVSQFTSAFPPSPYDNIDPVYENREFVPAEVSQHRPIFLKVGIELIRIVLFAEKGHVHIDLGKGISMDYSSLNDGQTNSRIQLEIPQIDVEFLTANSLKKNLSEEVVKCKSVGKFSSGIFLRKHFRKPSVLQDFNVQQDFLIKNQASNLFETHYSKFEGADHVFEENAEEVRTHAPNGLEGDSAVQEDITNVSDLSFMHEEEVFHDPDSDTDSFHEEESFISFDSDNSDFESDDDRSFSHQQRKPYVETVTGKKVTMKDDVIKRIEEQLHELLKQTQSNSSDQDEDIIFFKDEKMKRFAVSAYEEFLRTLIMSRESDEVISPLHYSSQSIPGVPHISSSSDSIGTYAYWPRTELRDISSQKIHDYHYIHTSQAPLASTTEQHTQQSRETMESMEAGEQCSFSHYSLQFVRAIDILLTPHAGEMIGSIICAIMTPVGQNINATCDDIENSNHEPKETNNDTTKYDRPPDFPLSKITLSCSLPAIKVHIMQAIRPPNIINSSLLKDLNVYSTKLVANNFFCAVSFSWKKELDNDKLKSELFSVEGSFTLESLRMATQCFTKTKDVYRGISDFELNEEVLKSIIAANPVVLSGNAENISIKTIHRLGKDESQGRISCTSGKPLELFSTQEIPLILFSMYEVWEHTIRKQVSSIKATRTARFKAKITLLAGISRLKGEENSDAPTQINDQGDFVINHVQNVPIQEAILDVRRKIRVLSTQEKEILQHWIDSVSTDSTSIKKLKQNVSFAHWSLIEDSTFAPHLQEQIKTSGSSLFDRKMRIDLFVSIQQLSFALHAHAANSGSVKKSTGSIHHVDLRGQLEIKTDKVHKLSTNQFLHTATNTQSVKRRDISTIMNLNVDSIDVDIHPRAYEVVTVIAGIVVGLKSHANLQRKRGKSKVTRDPFQWLNKKSNSSPNIITKPPTDHSSSNSSLHPDTAQLRSSLDTDPAPHSVTAKNRRSIIPLLDSNKQVETSFHGFFNLLVGKVEARAWMSRGINFAQLTFDKISLCVNKPRMNKASSRHLDKNSKLIQCASGSVQKIHFEYNFAPLPKEGTAVPDFISLFDTTIRDVGVNQFYFTTGDKNGKISDHIQFLQEIGSISIYIPYSDTWSAASLQFKLFVLDWWQMVKQKPDVKVPAQFDHPMSESSDGASSMPPKEATTTASLKLPSISMIVDIHNIQLLFMLLPTLQMRYSMSRVMAFFNRENAKYNSFRLHVFSNSLAFKTNTEDTFPEQFNPQWKSPHTFRTGASETKNFKKLFLLPEVLVYGDLNIREGRPHLKASVIVEYVENIITGDIINYIMSVQSSIVKEVNNILIIVQNRINKDDITERIRSEFPRAQASVKKLNAYFDINVFLEGLHFTAFSPATAVILDSGKIDVGVSREQEGVKWNVDLSNSSMELVDLANFKWSDKKEFQGKYSNSKQCYKWASFSTNVHVENRIVSLAEQSASTPDENGNATHGTATSTQKLFVTIADTNVCIRPGCPQIALLMFRDYQESVRNLVSELKESRKHLNTEILKQLIETGEEYYTYYSEKIVKSVTSDPTMLIYSGLVRVTNSTLTIPLGDNPYFGFLYNSNPSFSPTAVIHVMLTSVDLTTRTLTDPSGQKKARGIIVVNNVYAYADECTKNDIKNQSYTPSMTKFMDSSHRCNLPDAFVGIDFNMDASVLRAKVTATVSGPEVSVNPGILNHILDLSRDWFSGRAQLRSSDDLLHRVIKKQIQTPKILTESEATVPLLKQKVHVTCHLKVKSGECKFHHTLDVPVQTSEKPVWASISEHQDVDPSIVAVATLPSFLIDVVHISPSLVSFTTGGTSTNLQINVNWKGVRLDPKSMLFLNEGWFTYQEYSKKQKKLRQQRKWKLVDFNQYSKIENCAKPERWMKYVNSAIMIQRLFRGYLTRKIIREMKAEGTPCFTTGKQSKHADSKPSAQEDKPSGTKSSLSANSISVLCRVQPFSVHMTSSPVSDVITCFEFSKPFDILFTRMHRHLHRRNEKGDALFNTVFLNSPEILVRMYNSLNPDEFLRLMISGVVANVGAGYGPLLRPDREATLSGTISIDKIKVQFNLPQISQLLLMYSLWMEKSAEAKQALANQISKVQSSTRIRRNQTKETELTLESTISKYGQVLIKKIEINSDLDYMIGKQLMEIHSVSLFIRDRGRFLNSQSREPMHIGGYITRGVVRLTGRLSGAIHASGLTVGMDHEFPVADAQNPVYRGKTDLKVRILPLDLSIDYNMDKIITLYSESFIGQFQDVFDLADGLKSHIQCKFSLETLILRLSSVAAPAFIRVFYSLLDTLKNRRNNALKVLQRSTFYYHRDSILASDEIEKDIRTIKQLKVKSPVEHFKDFNILGNVTVFGSNINIFLHDRFKLDDKNQLSPMDGRLRGDYTSFGVEEFQVKFVRNAEELPGSTAENPNFTVLRKIQLFLLKADIDRNRVSSQRISLIRVPGGSVIMKSKQSNLNDVIHFQFTSRFPDSITVSTNLAEYTFFRKLLGFYQESVKKELNTKGSDSESNDFAFSPPEESNVPSSPKSEKSSLFTLLNQEFTGDINFNPKLDVLGDMTPSVETVLGWLGITDRSFVAKLTHMAVSNSLEGFLIGCKKISDGVEKVTGES